MGSVTVVMKRLLLFIFCALSFTSCERPPIKPADFADICHDMFLVRAYVEKNPVVEVSTDSLSVYGAILDRYGYSPDEFRRTVDYYVSNPDDYARLLKNVQSRISKEKRTVESLIKDANESASASSAAEFVELTEKDIPQLDSIPLTLKQLSLIFP